MSCSCALFSIYWSNAVEFIDEVIKSSLYPALLTFSQAHQKSTAPADIFETKSQIRYVPSTDNHVFSRTQKIYFEQYESNRWNNTWKIHKHALM